MLNHTTNSDPSFKQKDLRSKTIASPQARCREFITQAFPAEPNVAAEYSADTISTALAGASPEDLEHAKWAQVPSQAYMTAVRFSIAHSEAYADLNIDEEAAKKHFQQLVPECICAQATRVEAEGSFPPGLSGPASAKDADVSLQEVVVAGNDVPMLPEAESCARAHVAGENDVGSGANGRSTICRL